VRRLIQRPPAALLRGGTRVGVAGRVEVAFERSPGTGQPADNSRYRAFHEPFRKHRKGGSKYVAMGTPGKAEIKLATRPRSRLPESCRPPIVSCYVS
jgi:hypothetical protein